MAQRKDGLLGVSNGPKWIMARRNGDPGQRLVVVAFKKALIIYESESAIDRYITLRGDLAKMGALGRKTRISLLKTIEILRRFTDCDLVSIDWVDEKSEGELFDRVDYLMRLEEFASQESGVS